MNHQKLIAYIRYYLESLGWVGMAGLGLIGLAIAGWFVQVQPQQQALADLQDHIAVNRTKINAIVGIPKPLVMTESQKIEAFFHSFPSDAEAPNLLRRMFKAAGRSGISLETGEYAVVDVQNSHLKQYRVTLPVKGELVQILAFISGVIKAAPTSALEDVTFRREKIEDGQVDAKLVFIFFVNTEQ